LFVSVFFSLYKKAYLFCIYENSYFKEVFKDTMEFQHSLRKEFVNFETQRSFLNDHLETDGNVHYYKTTSRGIILCRKNIKTNQEDVTKAN
jgi:hypothetical protein